MPTLIFTGANYKEALKRLPPECSQNPSPLKKARKACVQLCLKGWSHFTTAICRSDQDNAPSCLSDTCQRHDKVGVVKWSEGELLCQPNLQKRMEDVPIFNIGDVHDLMSPQLFSDVVAAPQ